MAALCGGALHIGRLDQQIEIFSHAETNNGGALTPVYTSQGIVWAHVISQRGSEALESARVNAKETLRIMMRYRADVTNKWRITWNGQSYNIINTDRSQHRAGELWVTAQVVGAL